MRPPEVSLFDEGNDLFHVLTLWRELKRGVGWGASQSSVIQFISRQKVVAVVCVCASQCKPINIWGIAGLGLGQDELIGMWPMWWDRITSLSL